MAVITSAAVDMEPEREGHRQIVLGASERDVEQSELLVETIALVKGHVGWDVAVRGVDERDGSPLTSLGRMDRREDQVVVIEMRSTGQVAGSLGRIDDELREKPLSVRVGSRGRRKLVEISEPRSRVVVPARENRGCELAQAIDLGR